MAADCGRWGLATSKMLAKEAARKLKTAAKMKALQRTPQHMIINRMRLLVERIQNPGALGEVSSGLHGSSNMHEPIPTATGTALPCSLRL